LFNVQETNLNSVLRQKANDINDMDIKDLAVYVLSTEFPNFPELDKLAGDKLSKAIQDGEKDKDVIKASTTLNDKRGKMDGNLKEGGDMESKKKELIKKLKAAANKATTKLMDSTFDQEKRNKGAIEIQRILADKIKEVEKLK
jgi:hypothetical protein